jgi:hypothetical protein
MLKTSDLTALNGKSFVGSTSEQQLPEAVWINALDGSRHTLPTFWDYDNYYDHNAQTYFVDPSGQRYLLDSDTGWWYPLSAV